MRTTDQFVTIRMEREAFPDPTVTHEEKCDTCRTKIVGVRHHRRGTFYDLCSAHFDQLAERAAFDAIDSTPCHRLRPTQSIVRRATACVARKPPSAFRGCHLRRSRHEGRNRAGAGGGHLGRVARARLGLEGCGTADGTGFVRWFAADRIGSQASLSTVPRGRGC